LGRREDDQIIAHAKTFPHDQDPTAVRPLDRVDDLRRDVVRVHVLGKHVGRWDDLRAHAELVRGLNGDGSVVAGHHLDLDPLLVGLFDRRL
jgi:hypothetical protein